MNLMNKDERIFRTEKQLEHLRNANVPSFDDVRNLYNLYLSAYEDSFCEGGILMSQASSYDIKIRKIINGHIKDFSDNLVECFGKKYEDQIRKFISVEYDKNASGFRKDNWNCVAFGGRKTEYYICTQWHITEIALRLCAIGFVVKGVEPLDYDELGELLDGIDKGQRQRRESQIDNLRWEIDRIIKEPMTYIMKDKSNGFYKIGKSISPKIRERTLQSEKPVIELVKTWDYDIEKTLHEQYKRQRIRGEWFNLTKLQLKYICKHY